MIPRILGTSRFLILIAVVGSFLAATTLMIYGGLTIVSISLQTLRSGSPTSSGAKALMVDFIEMIDLFLLCVVLYIIATGLYKLFVGPIDIPNWLQIQSLDGLKAHLVSVINVLLAVIFLGRVVTEYGSLETLYLGIAVALVMAVLVLTLKFGHHDTKHAEPEHAHKHTEDSKKDKEDTHKPKA
jgi:uncharacterized membrane protein YqhA